MEEALLPSVSASIIIKKTTHCLLIIREHQLTPLSEVVVLKLEDIKWETWRLN